MQPKARGWREVLTSLTGAARSPKIPVVGYKSKSGIRLKSNNYNMGGWHDVKLNVYLVPFKGEGSGAQLEIGGAEIR